MKPWMVAVEGISMLLLWFLHLGLDAICGYVNDWLNVKNISVLMASTLGTMHLIINGFLIKILYKSTRRLLVALLCIAQLPAVYFLCKGNSPLVLLLLCVSQLPAAYLFACRAWLSISSLLEKDETVKDQLTLRAKYNMCWELESFEENHFLFPTQDRPSRLSCVPPPAPVASAPPVSEDESTASHSEEEAGEEPRLRFAKTEFQHGSDFIIIHAVNYATSNISEEVNNNSNNRSDHCHLSDYLLQIIKNLFVGQKRLSYHIVTDPNDKLLYISTANRYTNVQLNRELCTDTHYIVNLTKGSGYETFQVMTKTHAKSKVFNRSDLSRFIWIIVLPSTAFRLGGLIAGSLHYFGPLLVAYAMSPLISIVTYVVTDRRSYCSWTLTLFEAPLRIGFTVCRMLLLVSATISFNYFVILIFVSSKAMGILTFMAYVAHAKKIRRIDLYSHDVDQYSFQSINEPVIQIGEGTMYIIWALYWYFNEYKITQSLTLVITIITITGQVCGVGWLLCVKRYMQNPLRDQVELFTFIKQLADIPFRVNG